MPNRIFLKKPVENDYEMKLNEMKIVFICAY